MINGYQYEKGARDRMKNEMSCIDIREVLSLYLDHMLDESQMKEIEAHLAVCDACRIEYEALKEVVLLLSDLEVIPVPDGFQARMKAALEEEKTKKQNKKFVLLFRNKSYRKLAMSIAAVFFVGIVSYTAHVNGVIFNQIGDAANEQSTIVSEESTDISEDVLKKIVGESNSGTEEEYIDEESNDSFADLMMDDQEETKDLDFYGTTNSSSQDSDEVSYGARTVAPSMIEADNGGYSGDSTNDDAESDGSSDSCIIASLHGTESSIDSNSASLNEFCNNQRKVTGDCSRSLGIVSVERNAAAIMLYTDLIKEKLDGFDYQIIESQYLSTGEWQFSILILRDKSSITYNKEIIAIGKNGDVTFQCTEESMGL